jgi:hypothetical protein
LRATSLVMRTFGKWKGRLEWSKCKKKCLNLLEVGITARIVGSLHNWGQIDQTPRLWGETEWLKQFGLN